MNRCSNCAGQLIGRETFRHCMQCGSEFVTKVRYALEDGTPVELVSPPGVTPKVWRTDDGRELREAEPKT